MTRRQHLLGAAIVAAFAPGAAAQNPQHGGQYAPADIQHGAAIYAVQCINCHGPNGDGVAGINLRAGRFKRVNSDDDLRTVVTSGVTGTGMPAFNFTPAEVIGIVSFVRNMDVVETGSVVRGNASTGRVLYEGKGKCNTCHRVNGQGSRTGPNLSDVGSLRTAGALEKSLLDPTANMLRANRFVRAVTKSGRTYLGRRLNESTYTVQLIDESETLVSLNKGDLREYAVLKTSPLPSYKDVLSESERADLLAYLLTLREMK
jgi:putative heme-binding domain-containing protein